MGQAHDVFEWWSAIWIPALLGLTTVFVSIAALVASARATKLAHEVELQRERAAQERIDDSRRERLQFMAIEDARILHRYVTEALRPGLWRRPLSSLSSNPERPPREQALIDATVALQQSFVPGAASLLDLTKFDVSNYLDWLPEVDDELDAESREAETVSRHRDLVVEARLQRTYERIRDWALAPDQSEPYIESELEETRKDPQLYWLKAGPIPDGF